MIAYDGSDAAKRAIEAAGRLFPSSRAFVVTVWEPGLAYAMADLGPGSTELSPTVMDVEGAQEMADALEAQAQRTAAEGAELGNSAGLDCEPLAVADERHVAGALVRVARNREVDAIVVGSRGLSGLRARLEGSTSSAVLKDAPCPVVVVHED
jgi:nucleotide-binding universal stress UspA family protein